MFAHSYDSYMMHAYPEGEIKPISCKPGIFDLVKIPGLTLIDTLDTLLVLGNTTEFARSVERLRLLNEKTKGGMFALNENVSVFETNIRVLGGLLSAHQMAVAFMSNQVVENQVWNKEKDRILWEHKSTNSQGETRATSKFVDLREEENDALLCSSDTTDCASTTKVDESKKKQNITKNLSKYWKYDGFLLKLARDIGARLLPAFRSKTGIPYGTVNLLYGIPSGETPVASLAGGGTLTLEMELLSRLTGDSSFGKAAKLASRALWMRRSSLNLVGKHIDVQTGSWTETLSGVGSNSDSFFEYLAKHYMLFPEDDDFWLMFQSAYSGLHQDARIGEWYIDVDMKVGLKMGTNGGRRVFESLAAFYPGMQTLLGEVAPAARSLNSFFMIREFLGFLPERFDYGMWRTDIGREGAGKHPLRPELLESCYLMHQATKVSIEGNEMERENGISGWLWAADFALHTLESVTRTNCGYASLRDVSSSTTGASGENSRSDRITFIDEMPSFFLSETLKYLYLTFDENNILHTDNDREWIFTTEAHPIHNVPPVRGARIRRFERIRKAVKERLINGSSQLNMTQVLDPIKRLEREKWSESSKIKSYKDDIQSVLEDVAMENEAKIQVGKGYIADFFGDTGLIDLLGETSAGNDVFGETKYGGNIAHLSLRNVGLGDGICLRKACPNFHAVDLLWLRALNGGALDYADTYVSSTSDEKAGQQSQFVLLGAADALGLYGSGIYLGRLGEDADEKCFIESHTIENSSTSKIEARTVSSNRRGERIDMGGDLGVFEVSSFSEGSGFYMEHVESGESVMATFIVDDSVVVDSPQIYVMAYATVPDLKNQDIPVRSHDNTVESRLRMVGPSWASLFMTSKQAPEKSNPVVSSPERTVVMADFEGNAFVCEVKIIKRRVEFSSTNDDDLNDKYEDQTLGRYPCAPALFGPTHLTRLFETNGVLIEEVVSPPKKNDKFGCIENLEKEMKKSVVSNDSSVFDESNDTNRYGENLDKVTKDAVISNITDDHIPQAPTIQMIHRGMCTFRAKAVNQMKNANAVGVIVVNTEKEDLFVMSHGREEEADGEQVPVSVLVSGVDGESIIRVIGNDHQDNKTFQYVAQISLLPQQGKMENSGHIVPGVGGDVEWPIVKGSNEALQIFAEGGWGIHAVPRTSTGADKTGRRFLDWQLFLLRHAT